MSKNGFKKFRKNDHSYEDEDVSENVRSHYLDRQKERRVQRALKTKDISALIEDEDDYDLQNDYKHSMRGH